MNEFKSLADDSRWIFAMKEKEKHMDKIEKLEKENAELHAKITANRFIFKTKVRNEYLDKIEDLELQRDGQSITITELKKQVNGNLEYIDQLKNKLKGYREPKTLNRQEVEKIFKGHCLSKVYDMQPFGMGLKGVDMEPFITAICKLASVDREKIMEHKNKTTKLPKELQKLLHKGEEKNVENNSR